MAGNAWFGALFLFALGAVLRIIDLDHLPRIDELFTILAARGWVADGVPSIGDGLYPRAQLFTILIAQLFELFGESLVVARLLALVAGSLLAVAVYLWTRAVAGNLAGWIAGLFTCLSPQMIIVSQYARFYTLQILVFWLVAICVYGLFESRHRPATAVTLAVAGGLGFAFAVHLQPVTLIGAVGLAAWWVLAIGGPWLWARRQKSPRQFSIIVTAVALGLAVLALWLWQSGLAADYLDRYLWSPLHSLARRGQVWFYHLELIQRYPTLWPLLPFVAMLAVASRPRPVLFCLIVFTTGFVLLSFGGMKHLNYLSFLLPFLFVVWAIALARAWPALVSWVTTVTDRAVRAVLPGATGRGVRWTLISAGLLFLVVASGAPARTLLKPFGISLTHDESSIDWGPVKAELEPWLSEASIVLTPNDLHALYYLGDYDVAVNPNRLSEIQSEQEFSLDPRFGRPIVATLDSVRRIMDCYPSGLFVADTTMYPIPWGQGRVISDYIRLHAISIELPSSRQIRAFRWQQPGGWSPPDDCASLPDLGSPPKALGAAD